MKIIRQNFPTSAGPTEGLRPAEARTTPANNPGLHGTIRAVEPTREMLLLHQLQEDRDQIIHWLPQTRFVHHGLNVKPDALHQGQQISVQFSSDGGQKFAKEIDIVVEPPVAEPAGGQNQSPWAFRPGSKARN